MLSAGYQALYRIGAKSRGLNADYRGSFAFIGYSGKGKPSFVQQVSNPRNFIKSSQTKNAVDIFESAGSKTAVSGSLIGFELMVASEDFY